MLISIIMAVYNEEEYIQDSINSILEQTYQKFEIIICDDNSSDSTVSIIESIMKQDNRIRLIKNKKNLKAAASRNKCIEISKGNYIAIQDGDDTSSKYRLEKQKKFLDNNTNYDFVSSKMVRVRSDGTKIYMKNINSKPENKDFLLGNPYPHAATIFRKEALEKVNGYLVSEMTTRGQDYDMFMRMHINGLKGYILNEDLYYYLEDNEAYSRRKFKYRIDGVKIRYMRFNELGLLPRGFIYVIKPLVAGFVPSKVMQKYHNLKHKINE